MKWTNLQGLPQAFVDAVTNDSYSKGDAEISITGLLKPPKAIMLERKHWDEIEQDVEERTWALFGQVCHTILERASSGEVLTEKRLFMTIGGVLISGQIDSLDLSNGCITDYKTTNMYKIQKKLFDDYEKQVNCYAHLLRENGHKVEKAQIFGIIRDHRDYEYRQYVENPTYKTGPNKGQPKPEYPASPLTMIPIQLWEPAIVQKFLEARVEVYKAAKKELPDCTRDETWEGRKCERYCSAAPFCAQYQEVLKKRGDK